MISTSANDFRVTLAFPPQGHWTQPHLAIPSLVAWLRAHGYRDVEQLDLSVSAFDHFVSPAYLERARERVRERLPLSRFSSEKQLEFANVGAWRAAAEAEACASAVIARVEQAKAVVRGQDAEDDESRGFWDADRYLPSVRTLYHALRIVSAAHYPSELTPHNFTMRYSNDRSAEVLAATLDEEENPFIEFYRDCVMPSLVARAPRVLGLSVLYGSQLVPALTLGRLVKRALPDCHVTMGGGYLAYVGGKVMAAQGMEECLDSIVFHEGEAPLLALCEALRTASNASDTDLSEVGSLAWFDRRGEEVRSVRNAPAHPIKLDEAPAPDLDGLPFDLYFSPRLVIPYDVNRGCYYGECTFCTLPTVIGPGYRTRSADTIARHAVKMRDRYDTTHFNFITDCMPPGMIRELPDALIAAEAGITWWADARVEPKAYTGEGARNLYRSGCRKLLFGFETASKRILKAMMKGQSLKSVVEVAENCAAADISVTFYAMVGFPTETREEARATMRFLEQHAGVVREVSLQTFHIDEVARTYQEPERFGLKIIDDAGADLALYHDYEAAAGMTQEEAAEMFQELMVSFREHLPLFADDHVFYFMQKSHYFLHLATGETPDSFAERLRLRQRGRHSRGAEGSLAPRADLNAVELEFPYRAAIELLAHPLARAARPDFLTGRYVADAEREARERLAPLDPRASVLLYDGETAEFVEVRPDGWRLLRALSNAGSLEALAARVPSAQRSRLDTFAGTLHRRGILAVRAESDSETDLLPASTPRSASDPRTNEPRSEHAEVR